MSDDPPALHAASCQLDDCDFVTIRSNMVGITADLEDHMKDEHDYTDEEWRDARDRLAEAKG